MHKADNLCSETQHVTDGHTHLFFHIPSSGAIMNWGAIMNTFEKKDSF